MQSIFIEISLKLFFNILFFFLLSFSYFVYFQKQRTSKVYLLDATMVFPMALLIFGDGVKQGELSPREPYISVADTYLYVLCGNG